MMFHRHRRSILFGLSTLLIFCTLLGVQVTRTSVAYAAYTVTVTPGSQYQTIQGWGTSLAWWAENIGGWSNSQRTVLADALYSPSPRLSFPM